MIIKPVYLKPLIQCLLTKFMVCSFPVCVYLNSLVVHIDNNLSKDFLYYIRYG